MLYNYIITALRNLKRHKLYSIINIFGLAVGLGIFILAVVFFSFHLNFDTYHKDYKNIYVVISETNPTSGVHQRDASTRLPLANLMAQNFPEIENAAVYRENFREIFRYKDVIMYENNVFFADTNFLKVFNYPIIKGNTKTPLSKPNSVVLTESAAKKYFGEENPVGKILHTDFSNNDFMVTAVTEDCPLNSSFRFDILVSLPDNYREDWGIAGSTYTFVKLKPGANVKTLESKIPAFIEQYVPVLKETKVKLKLFPLQDIHLKSMNINSGFNNTPIFQYYLIVAVAAGLLIIVAINFMVLSTSRYGNRAKEVGVRKVVGADKIQLIKQYIGESVILSCFALPLALALFEIMRAPFIAIVGGGIELNLWHNPVILLIVIGVTLLVGFISGIYPAFFLSSIRPTLILKNQLIINKKGFTLRKGLVIFQFALSFTMIAFTLTSIKQMDMISEIDLGYNRENIITVSVNNEFYKKFDVIEKELKQNPNISIVSTAHVLPFSWGRQEKMRPEGVDKNNSENIYSYPCGYNFIEVIDIKIVKGRSFSREFNDENSIIISETTAKHFGLDDPIGKIIILDERGENKRTIVGVAKDFHFPHVFFEKAPAVIYFLPKNPFYLFIKTITKPDDNTINFVKEIWNKTVPELPFEYSILNYAFEENLRSTTRTLDIFKFISIISVFIACLGLFALSSYTVERKTREIGIRKVLGASVNKIMRILISEFLILVIISNIIALPFAYYFSSYLINVGWVYKTELNISLFIAAAVVSVLAALLAVGIQSVKAAMANPVESLRYE
jgi:putative ABC transport system permease protein